jgi:hypothetical protein
MRGLQAERIIEDVWASSFLSPMLCTRLTDEAIGQSRYIVSTLALDEGSISNTHSRSYIMLRKQVIPRRPVESASFEGDIPVAQVATVQVSSEQAIHPIDNVFDNRRGPGGSCWIADGPGEQTLILVFDSPQTIRKVSLEVEELSVSRTQELSASVSSDGGRTYRKLVRQEFTFSPPSTSFEREVWSVEAEGVTHLRLDIKPDKGGRVGQATLTSLSLA